MTDEVSKAAYRERLEDGEVVYVVDGENSLGGGQLVIKKGTITNSKGLRYPTLLLWDALDSGPGAGTVTKSPREVFTSAEVLSLIEHDDPSLLATSAVVDKILIDPIAARDVVPILGGAVIQRLAQDELAFPGDPER